MFKSFITSAWFIMCLHIYKTESHQVITSNKCIPSKNSFVKLVGISLGECVNACVRRHACQSIGFRRRMNYCELHKESNAATSANEDDSCIFIERSDMDTTYAQKCDCTHVGHVCDPNSGKCTIGECGQFDMPNGEVYGNVNYIGAKLQITCNKGYVERRGIKQVICKSTGNWEPTPTCEAEGISTTTAAPVDTSVTQTNIAEIVGTTLLTTSAAAVDTSVAQTNIADIVETTLPTLPITSLAAFLPSTNYLGCFVDNDIRLLELNMIANETMTTNFKMCFEHCSHHGMRFFLTEYGKQCHCGNVLKNYEIRPDIECNMPCGGNKSEMCGGWWRGSVYDTMPLADLPSVSFLGCYVDNETRFLDLSTIQSDMMTTKMCYDHCCNNGTRYFLTEYSKHCFCGNVLRNYEIRPDAECNKSCAGDNNEKCGGFWRGSLYIRSNFDLCPAGWIRYGQSCYYFSSDEMTWQNASLACQILGGSLLEVDDSSENNFIVGNVKQYNNVSFWIGLSDQATEGTFVWYGSQRLLKSVGFSDWCIGTPDNSNEEDCTRIDNPNCSSKWNDVPCSMSNRFICEK